MSVETDERFAEIIEQELITEDAAPLRQEPKRLSFTPKRQPSHTSASVPVARVRNAPAIPEPEHQQLSQTQVVARELGLAKQRHSTDFCGSHGPGTCCRSDEDRLAGRRPTAVQRYSDIIVATRIAIVTCFAVGLTAATIRVCWLLVTTILF